MNRHQMNRHQRRAMSARKQSDNANVGKGWIEVEVEKEKYGNVDPLRRYVNGAYVVTVYSESAQANSPDGNKMNGLLRMEIKRNDAMPVTADWIAIQGMKNHLIGSNRLAVELYPQREKTIIDHVARQVWILPKGKTLGFGFNGVAGEHFDHRTMSEAEIIQGTHDRR